MTAERERALAAHLVRARTDPSRVVLEGFHALKHAVRFGASVERACATDRERVLALARDLAPDLLNWLRKSLAHLSEEALAALTDRPPEGGVMAVARRPEVEAPSLLHQGQSDPLVVLDRPTHLGNVGAAIRVAAAAGAGGLLTTGPGDPWHPMAVRGAAGLQFALPVARLDDGWLVSCRRPLIALDPDGEPLSRSTLPPGAVLAFGSERHGLSAEVRERADRRLRIPMRAGVSSLNLATAVAVVLYTTGRDGR